MAEESRYHVVFEYNDNASPGYRGNRYRVSFKGKEGFVNSRLTGGEGNRITDVVAEGVSDEESLALCEQVDDR